MKKIFFVFSFLFFLFISRLSVNAYSTPSISFSADTSTVNVSYDKGNWNLVRPVIPNLNFPTGGITYWVSTNGDDNNLGTSSNPFKTIQKGVSMAHAGDIVYIKAGVYPEMVAISNSGSSTNPLVVSSAPGDLGNVKVVATSIGPVIMINNNAQYVWINGLVIEGTKDKTGFSQVDEDFGANGISWWNGAGHGKATNNVVYDNMHCGLKELGHGGNTFTFIGNIVFNNGTDAHDHGFYFGDYDTLIDGNIVFDNAGWGLHLYSAPTRFTVTRNIIIKNFFSGILVAGSNSKFYNNVSAYNGNGGGIMYFRAGAVNNDIKNNIFAFNNVDGVIDNGGGSNNTDDYNIYTKQPNYAGSGVIVGSHEIYADPKFVNPVIGDFRLQSTSPAKNAGSDGKDLGAFATTSIRQPINISDFHLLLSTFTSIFDYNQLVANFGR
ncbi:MAG: right-handed parallel beta-helix repeat-containing protein [Candidatus Gottesmanbacteria bacterium]